MSASPKAPRGLWPLDPDQDTRIDNYQAVVPTTWNGGPRDAKGQIGAFEASLMDTPVAKADEPLEILRTCIPSTRAWPAPPMCCRRTEKMASIKVR